MNVRKCNAHILVRGVIQAVLLHFGVCYVELVVEVLRNVYETNWALNFVQCALFV